MPGRSFLVVTIALALTASGCESGFRCARKGGAEWRELRTEHFVLRTDHSATAARGLALELERIRDAVAKGLLESEPASSPLVQVVVPKRAKDFGGPASPVALHALTRFLLDQGRARDALPHARRAVEVAPWSPRVLDGAAGVLEALGDCRGALALQERAVDNAGEHARSEVRSRLVERRDRLHAACGGEQ